MTRARVRMTVSRAEVELVTITLINDEVRIAIRCLALQHRRPWLTSVDVSGSGVRRGTVVGSRHRRGNDERSDRNKSEYRRRDEMHVETENGEKLESRKLELERLERLKAEVEN